VFDTAAGWPSGTNGFVSLESPSSSCYKRWIGKWDWTIGFTIKEGMYSFLMDSLN
jgi:hypothetical protein